MLKDSPKEKWIKVKGDGTIPIELMGIKGGQWKLRCRDGQCFFPKRAPNEYGMYWWSHKGNSIFDVIEVRIIQTSESENEWILVKGDGTIPEQVRGKGPDEFQVLFRDGDIRVAEEAIESYWQLEHQQAEYDIVAVRLIKRAKNVMQQVSEAVKADSVKNNLEEISKQIFKSLETEQQNVTEKKPDKVEARLIDFDKCKLILKGSPTETLETEKQRLTREASTKYFENHFKKTKPFLPIGEAGIEDAIFQALTKLF